MQVAGREGLPEVLGSFLLPRPYLSQVNGCGGALFSTIIHGSDTTPARADRGHIACLAQALEEGVALPRAETAGTVCGVVRGFLEPRAARYPGQVV